MDLKNLHLNGQHSLYWVFQLCNQPWQGYQIEAELLRICHIQSLVYLEHIYGFIFFIIIWIIYYGWTACFYYLLLENVFRCKLWKWKWNLSEKYMISAWIKPASATNWVDHLWVLCLIHVSMTPCRNHI